MEKRNVITGALMGLPLQFVYLSLLGGNRRRKRFIPRYICIVKRRDGR